MSPEEKRIYDQLQRTCSKPLRSLQMWQQQNCVLLKKQLEDEAAQKQRDVEQLLRQQQQWQRTKKYLDAGMYIVAVMNKMQVEGQLLLGAVIGAGMDYDAILQARAAKPVLGEILYNVLFTALPEMAILGGAIQRFWPRGSWSVMVKDVARSNATTWEGLVSDLGQIAQARADRVEKFAVILDKQWPKQVEAIRKPLKSSGDVDTETAKRLAAYHAKNAIFTQILNGMANMLQIALMFQQICIGFIYWYEGDDVKEQIMSTFKNANIDANEEYKAATFDLLRKIILYDMLRLYVSQNFAVTIEYIPPYAGSPENFDPKQVPLTQYVPEDMVQGLDQAQRDMIYDEFGNAGIPWKNDSARPPINDYQDLLKKWGGKVYRVPKVGVYRPG